MSKHIIFGLLFVGIVIVSTFLPWLTIESKHLVFTGLQTNGSSFGEPGKLNIFFAVIIGILFLVRRKMAARINLFLAAFLMAWAFRNLLLFGRCEMGECPDREIGLYLSLVGAIGTFVAVLFSNGEK